MGDCSRCHVRRCAEGSDLCEGCLSFAAHQGARAELSRLAEQMQGFALSLVKGRKGASRDLAEVVAHLAGALKLQSPTAQVVQVRHAAASLARVASR